MAHRSYQLAQREKYEGPPVLQRVPMRLYAPDHRGRMQMRVTGGEIWHGKRVDGALDPAELWARATEFMLRQYRLQGVIHGPTNPAAVWVWDEAQNRSLSVHHLAVRAPGRKRIEKLVEGRCRLIRPGALTPAGHFFVTPHRNQPGLPTEQVTILLERERPVESAAAPGLWKQTRFGFCLRDDIRSFLDDYFQTKSLEGAFARTWRAHSPKMKRATARARAILDQQSSRDYLAARVEELLEDRGALDASKTVGAALDIIESEDVSPEKKLPAIKWVHGLVEANADRMDEVRRRHGDVETPPEEDADGDSDGKVLVLHGPAQEPTAEKRNSDRAAVSDAGAGK